MGDMDVWREAERIVQRHGNVAESIAYLRLRDMKICGDDAGTAAWERVLEAIKALRRVSREAGKAMQ
jgi:hypothetical protein